MRTIVLSSGGTGGHVYPAQSLAEELTKRGYQVGIITDQRGKVFQDRLGDSTVFSLPIHHGRGKLAFLWLGLSILRGIFHSLIIYHYLKPVAVVGFGGYPSIPAVIAAWILRIPVAVHEQNAVLGRANRLAARFARRLAVSFHHTRYVNLSSEAKGDAAIQILTGNPVRPAILQVGARGYMPPVQNEPLRLFIVGGSQGAKIFSEVIPKAFAEMTYDQRQRFHVTQQCRQEMLLETRETYEALGMIVNIQPFFEDIDRQLQEAHLVIARSGASTVAELTVAGRPAIFVPYAAAMDGHQQANAHELAQEEAAWMILEKDFTPDRLAKLLMEILAAPDKLDSKSAKMLEHGRPNAVVLLADMVEDLLC